MNTQTEKQVHPSPDGVTISQFEVNTHTHTQSSADHTLTVNCSWSWQTQLEHFILNQTRPSTNPPLTTPGVHLKCSKGSSEGYDGL